MRKPRLTWRKAKRTSGSYREREKHELCRKGEVIAIVQQCDGGWFWYTFGLHTKMNTAANPEPTLNAAKYRCKEWVEDYAHTVNLW